MHSAMQSLSLLFRGNCNVINVTTLGGNYVITTNEIRKQKYLTEGDLLSEEKSVQIYTLLFAIIVFPNIGVISSRINLVA